VLNVGRGEVVDEAALVDALQKGHVGGAYLDVFETEPLPAESPLWDLPEVIVTPHNSAASRGNERRQAESFLANLARFGRGEPLLHEVEGPRAGGSAAAR
jgi:phosphoglycerate dehydrogenase-like enzyme